MFADGPSPGAGPGYGGERDEVIRYASDAPAASSAARGVPRGPKMMIPGVVRYGCACRYGCDAVRWGPPGAFDTLTRV